MTQSAAFNLRGQLAAALTAHASLSGVRVLPSAGLPMPATTDRQVTFELIESVGENAISYIDWDTRMFVSCLARAVGADDGETRADALCVAVLDVLMERPSPAPLGGIDIEVQGLRWESDEADVQVSKARAVLRVRHRTEPQTIAA